MGSYDIWEPHRVNDRENTRSYRRPGRLLYFPRAEPQSLLHHIKGKDRSEPGLLGYFPPYSLPFSSVSRKCSNQSQSVLTAACSKGGCRSQRPPESGLPTAGLRGRLGLRNQISSQVVYHWVISSCKINIWFLIKTDIQTRRFFNNEQDSCFLRSGRRHRHYSRPFPLQPKDDKRRDSFSSQSVSYVIASRHWDHFQSCFATSK